jgi:hypothetical protein
MTKLYLVTADDDQQFVRRILQLDREVKVRVTATLSPQVGLMKRVVYHIETVASRNALDRMEGVSRVRCATAA